MKTVPVNGPIVANSIYCNDILVARDVAVTLPEVVPMTADLSAMGTYSKPIWNLIDNMELAVTKVGVDLSMRTMVSPGTKPIEIRWVQTVTEATGNTRNVGCKAFMRVEPNKLPGIGHEVGSASDNECTYTVTRYQLIVDGVEMWLIDRLTGDCKIAGVDVNSIDSML